MISDVQNFGNFERPLNQSQIRICIWIVKSYYRSCLMRYQCHLTFFLDTDITKKAGIKAGDKGISVTKSKQQSPCSNCMHRPVMSWDNACSTCMHKPVRFLHWPVTSQADACKYCMGCIVSSLSQIYLYSSFFGWSVYPWNIFFLLV